MVVLVVQSLVLLLVLDVAVVFGVLFAVGVGDVDVFCWNIVGCRVGFICWC